LRGSRGRKTASPPPPPPEGCAAAASRSAAESPAGKEGPGQGRHRSGARTKQGLRGSAS
jgi:hypothetical protein